MTDAVVISGAIAVRVDDPAPAPLLTVPELIDVAIADPGTVHQLLREIDDILTHRPALGTLVDEVKGFRSVLATGTAAKPAGTLPLTPAELRLLPYLQTHLTADRIAKRLFLSSHTVKTEIKAIYRKLGVSSRNDAVQQATAIGLLGT